MSCANARIPRVGGDPPPADTDAAFESAYQQTLERYTRSQGVFDFLDTKLFVHATWESAPFMEARVKRFSRFRAMPVEEERAAMEAERQRLSDVTEFHLAVHANDPKMDDFDRAGSMWRIALVADGKEFTPKLIERIGRTTTEQRSIYSYMEPFWVGYRLRVPEDVSRPHDAEHCRVVCRQGRAPVSGSDAAWRARGHDGWRLRLRSSSASSARSRCSSRRPTRWCSHAFSRMRCRGCTSRPRSSRARWPSRVRALVGGDGARAFSRCLAVSPRSRFWLAVEFDIPFTSLGAYLFVEALVTQVSLAFWGTVGEAFDARESRRAFTWINGVGMSGAIAGGFIAQVAARAAGAPALMFGGGALLLAGFAAFRFHQGEGGSAPVARSGLASVRTVLEMPYASLLAVLVLGFSLIQQLTIFVFRQRAVELLGEADMADVFASHQLWTGVFCVVFQFVAAEPLLRRLGILRYVALVPGFIAVLTIVSWAWPSVWGAWALKLFESAASWSLLPVAVQLLYAPLPDDVRDGVRRTIDGLSNT